MIWAQQKDQFIDAAKEEFATVADAWLIAHAHAMGATVVTLEVFNPDIKKKIPIPNVCREFGVEAIDTFEMMRRLGMTLV